MKYYKADTDEVADIYILHLALLVNYYTELTCMQIKCFEEVCTGCTKGSRRKTFLKSGCQPSTTIQIGMPSWMRAGPMIINTTYQWAGMGPPRGTTADVFSSWLAQETGEDDPPEDDYLRFFPLAMGSLALQL